MRVRPRQSADSRNYSQDFFIFLKHSINSTRHFEDDPCVSSAESGFTVRLRQANEQEVSVFAMLHCQKHLIDCLIQTPFFFFFPQLQYLQ